MSEFKGTPGPWVATRGTVSAENNSVFCIADCFAPCVGPNWSGTDYTGEDYQLANARLIAAAPELLFALSEAIEIIDSIDGRDNSCDPKMDLSDLKSVIAKALGE